MQHHVDHLFVYGTLRPAACHALQAVLRRHARWLGPGTVAGRLYDLGRYPGLVPDTRGAGVRGDLYRLRHQHALLAVLDRYEGCGPRMPQPREYRREAVQVRFGQRRLWAWVYVYNRPVAGLRVVRGGDYLAWRGNGRVD
jgi:gamma-glutamylcyclotransferase (GGCT)/AIG2-like uncharacterized protein YtfP